MKQPWTPPQHKIIVAYRTYNHRLQPLKLDDGWLSQYVEILDIATFAPIIQLIMCQNVPYVTHQRQDSITIKNVIQGSLESFFQLDHQVDI